MPNLKFIHLQGLVNLKRFPDISMFPNVESLSLAGCPNLVEVHKSLGSLERLVSLDMSHCSELKRLPTLKMKSLETLKLSWCRSLETFPEVSPCMVKLSKKFLYGCYNLVNIPDSICELEHLKSLDLSWCIKLQKLPKKLGSMKKLEELLLGLASAHRNVINFPTLTNLCCLRKLDLSQRQIKDEDFPKNLHAFSSLEELDLSGNSKLIRFPDSISHLSSLKYLQLNDCYLLQNIQALPSRIQVLKSCNCKYLEHIEDLTEKYVWLYKIWLAGCKTLLEDQEQKGRLEKILQESFLKECAAVDRRVSIAIHGNKIPSWFKEQRHGSEIALQLPPKSHAAVMGFAVCGVFQGRWIAMNTITIRFRIENNGKLIRKSEVDYINSSATAVDESVWITYIPFSFFQQPMCDYFGSIDWSLSVSLLIGIYQEYTVAETVVRCGAHMVYKEDVESIQAVKTCILDYWNSDYWNLDYWKLVLDYWNSDYWNLDYWKLEGVPDDDDCKSLVYESTA